MATPEEEALAELDRFRLQAGMGRIDRSSPQARQAVQQAAAQEEFGQALGQAEQMANVRAQLHYETLRRAGLAGVAMQLRRARRAAAFDAARRGTTGGSVQIEREARARNEAETQAGQVIQQAQQEALGRREAELAPLFDIQTQLEQPTAFQPAINQAQLDLTNERLGGMAIRQQGRAIERQAQAGRAENRAANIRALFDSLGPAVQGGIASTAKKGSATDKER